MTKGDLIKGINQAREIHAEFPDFKFSIFLVHNNRVDDALHVKVHQRNTDCFISVTIIEQRDLIPFLDLDPEGQYLRQKLLGIDADRLSMSLLEEIALTNVERYGRDYYLKDSYLSKVSRQGKMKGQLDASTKTINLLIGDSGFGKSAFCFMVMRAIQKAGGIAYRVEPSVIEKAISIESAILQQLIIDWPKINAHLNDIRALFANSIIVIDDINKYANSTAILDKIISWNEKKKEGSITLLCPVWPRNLASLQNKEQKKDNYTVISVGRFSFNDCKSIIEQRINSGLPNLTEQEKHSLIIGTGFDPLLLGLSLQLLLNIKGFSEHIANEAIESYFSDAVRHIHNLHELPVYSINRALLSLGKAMLKSRKVDPHFEDIEKWLGWENKEFKVVSLIAAQRQLFSFDDAGKCFFRHDRVRDYLLTMAAATLLNNFNDHEDVLGDPYFAEIIGAALATIQMQKEMVEWLIQTNPLAVYISLKYLPDEPTELHRKLVLEVIEEWSSSIVTNAIPKSITNGYCWCFDGL